MQSLFNKIIKEMIESQKDYKISLDTSLFVFNGEEVDLNSHELLIANDDLTSLGVQDILTNPIKALNSIYKEYKYSTPDGNKNTYFKALSIEEMSDEEAIKGSNRKVSKFILELYILLLKHTDKMPWDNNHWFFQGEDKDFIILKKWIKKGEERND